MRGCLCAGKQRPGSPGAQGHGLEILGDCFSVPFSSLHQHACITKVFLLARIEPVVPPEKQHPQITPCSPSSEARGRGAQGRAGGVLSCATTAAAV